MNFERCDEPVHMDNLLCVGGVAHGERGDIPSNHDRVNCAMPLSYRLRKPEEVIDPRGCVRFTEYRRRWFGKKGERPLEVLVDVSVTEAESVRLFNELFKKGIRP